MTADSKMEVDAFARLNSLGNSPAFHEARHPPRNLQLVGHTPALRRIARGRAAAVPISGGIPPPSTSTASVVGVTERWSKALGRPANRVVRGAVAAADIRLVIASTVRLVREGLALSLRGREGVVLVDAVNLDPAGVARIADAAPNVVLVDLARADAATTAHLLKAACPEAKLVAFALA